MITILSRDEQRRATVSEGRDGVTATYYRRAANGSDRWVYVRCATMAVPLHLALDMAHGILNHGGTK